MKLSLIVAMDRNGVIGKGGGLPWPKIPEDMRHFRELTMGKPIIVGRKTYQFIPLRDDRPVYIVSRSLRYGHGTTYNGEGHLCDVDVVRSPLEAAAVTYRNWLETMVVGGGSIYAAFQGLVSEAHVTLIDREYEGDVRFPFPLLGSPDWEPLQEPRPLAEGVTYHRLGKINRKDDA